MNKENEKETTKRNIKIILQKLGGRKPMV